ncbi:HupE/UreJ family protein [Rhizobium sp. Root1220]|uniref:HupE/UreJ family protein n=1 Tax=Rhizobium sp. Root1220 TaxID=1736432 RepID=UPI0007010899|nr:HupE/UreJ family protein [Rhizobium sp. Root1220]KQV83560.1 urease accessory protein [Rhizobium sp. Root1220]
MSKFSKLTTALVAFALVPSLALAHTGVEATSGLLHGFVHPISGIDHVVAMIMVGVYAYQLGGRAKLLLPTTFVLAMAFGGLLGISGIRLPFVETGIALSVVTVGAVVALGVSAPTAVIAGITGMFAVCHGYAHGAEMPGYAAGGTYAIGFLLATALLHLTGMAFGASSERMLAGGSAARSSGGLAACAGVALLAGLI